jgi:hypothetical protein
MKDMQRRIARLKSERAHSNPGADAHTQAAACAEITEFLNAVSAEKAAGDVHGIADQRIAEFLAALERQA